MTCDTREENLRSFHFIKITSDNNNNASQWQGILVNPNGQSINLKNSANGCIMVPKVASDQATRLFIRDKLSSNYQEINPQVLESNTLSFVDVTKSVQQKNSSSVQLNCPKQTIYTNGSLYLEPQTTNQVLFDITWHRQKLLDRAGKVLLARKTLLPDATTQSLDLNKLSLPDGEYTLTTENQSVFDNKSLSSKTRCKIVLDRRAPDIQAVISQRFVPPVLNEPLSIKQGDYLEFFTDEKAVLINYCLVRIKDNQSFPTGTCNKNQSFATDKVELPSSGKWWLSYFASDLANNRSKPNTIKLHVRQNLDMRRIKNDLISSGYTVEKDQEATLNSLSSMLETYDKLESEIDRREALDFINRHLIELSPKVRELSRIRLNFDVLDIIGRPDSDYFAIQVKRDAIETIVLDKNLKTVKTHKAKGFLVFLDPVSWYFYDPQSKLLSLNKSDGYEKYISLDTELSPAKMVISKNLKYLASKTTDRRLVVIDLERNKEILNDELDTTSFSFNLRFNEASTHLYVQQSKSIHKYNLLNRDDISIYKHKSASMIIDIKIHTKKQNQDVSLLSVMYTDESAKANTGLYGLEWNSSSLVEEQLVDLNETLINTNDEPYYGILMEQNDDPYNPIVYFFNYYSKYTYEIDLNKEDFQVTRLEIPMPDPDVENRIASDRLRDQELLTLQSRIYLEQLKANRPYSYDPYPYVFGKKVLLISGGERIVVLTDGHLEIRSVYDGLGTFAYSNYFSEINVNIENKAAISFKNLSPQDLINNLNGYLALPQAIGSQRYVYIYDEQLKLKSRTILPNDSELKSMAWTDDGFTLLIALSHKDRPDSILKYDTKNEIQDGEIYTTKNDIRRIFSHRNLKNAFLTIEKTNDKYWQVQQINIFGEIQLFDNLIHDREIKFYRLDDYSFCIAAADIRCYGDKEAKLVTNNLANNTRLLAEKTSLPSCSKPLCLIHQAQESLEDFLLRLKDQESEIGTSHGKIVLSPSREAKVFDKSDQKLLSVFNTEIAGTIGEDFWYTFSNIGYFMLGNFKSKTPVFDLKPGYIADRELWHVDYDPKRNKVTLLFTYENKHLHVQSYFLNQEDNLNHLRSWVNAYKANTTNQDDF